MCHLTGLRSSRWLGGHFLGVGARFGSREGCRGGLLRLGGAFEAEFLDFELFESEIERFFGADFSGLRALLRFEANLLFCPLFS